MRRVNTNDFVTVTFDGFLINGELFESTKDAGPLEFQIGKNIVLPGFEKELLGMAVDEEKTFEVQPADGFGPKHADLIHTVKKDDIGVTKDIKPGMILGLTMEKGGETIKMPALVTNVEDDQVTIDFNHPLAGQVLKYTVKVEAIADTDCNITDCGCESNSSGNCDCCP